MNASELRVGNYVTRNKITGRVGYEFLLLLRSNLCITDYEPIPLTEELLLKLGFTKAENSYFEIKIQTKYQHFSMYISIEYGMLTFGNGELRFNAPEFVHEVQNIYYDFMKKELTLKPTT